MSWTDERVEQLRKLWLDGKSASQIAAELSNGITRNAVIGKVHRLGLSGRVKSPGQPAPRPRPAKPAATSHVGGAGGSSHGSSHGSGVSAGAMQRSQAAQRPSMPMTRGATALAFAPSADLEPPVLRPTEDVVIPMSERVTIMELKESMCRWPLGDPSTPEFRYCGSKSPIGDTYCGHHARIAYQPTPDRRRDRERRAQQLSRMS